MQARRLWHVPLIATEMGEPKTELDVNNDGKKARPMKIPVSACFQLKHHSKLAHSWQAQIR